MLASTKRGADILMNFGWETVCHSRNFVYCTRTENNGLTSSSSERGVISNPQPTSFIIANDLEFSGFLRHSNKKPSSSQGSSWQRSESIGVNEGQNTSCSPGSSWQRSESIGVNEGQNTSCSPGSSWQRSQLSGVDEGENTSCSPGSSWQRSQLSGVSEGHSYNSVETDIDISFCKSSPAQLVSDNIQYRNRVSASSCVLPTELEHGSVSNDGLLSRLYDASGSVKQLSMSNTESTVRSSLTLPRMICKEDELQQNIEKTTKHLMSAQDLSGYMKLRDLHPLTASSVTQHHLNSYGDTDAYKSKSLDFRVSRLRFATTSLSCFIFILYFV